MPRKPLTMSPGYRIRGRLSDGRYLILTTRETDLTRAVVVGIKAVLALQVPAGVMLDVLTFHRGVLKEFPVLVLSADRPRDDR